MDIRRMVAEGLPNARISATYPELAQKTHFFDMVTDKHVDDEILASLVTLLQGVERNEMTDDHASIMFGELLVNKYVKGKVPEHA
jgi:hypothetical protein